MKNVLKTTLSSVVVTALLFVVSTEAHAKKSRFSKLDTNSDGALSVEEFSAKIKNPKKGPKRFARLDVDGNGSLTPEEFAAQAKKKKKKKNK
ncbi:hypothetical protein [Pseudoalteromonas sp. ZZD1]|uniref:hypothetical protein n=1 Tax=Pseudoalteromonas sp. ZZD1 TaxID=3139395 RepID=UPI003BA8CD49